MGAGGARCVCVCVCGQELKLGAGALEKQVCQVRTNLGGT